MVGSLTGAVSSQIVTEEYEGTLGTVGNRADSAMAKACLTARLTSRAGAKAGHSDPVVLCLRSRPYFSFGISSPIVNHMRVNIGTYVNSRQ